MGPQGHEEARGVGHPFRRQEMIGDGDEEGRLANVSGTRRCRRRDNVVRRDGCLALEAIRTYRWRVFWFGSWDGDNDAHSSRRRHEIGDGDERMAKGFVAWKDTT